MRGKEIKIVARKVTSRERWYRVIVGKFDCRDEVLEEISILKDRNLLPLFGAVPERR